MDFYPSESDSGCILLSGLYAAIVISIKYNLLVLEETGHTGFTGLESETPADKTKESAL